MSTVGMVNVGFLGPRSTAGIMREQLMGNTVENVLGLL